ncbi:MAG TPA: sugar ABC transporter permease [Jatrophihabitantaceae bacterium]|jgi:multiple sugar transport system permease protein/raffinose/stachyose/melibiose transport system permease protein
MTTDAATGGRERTQPAGAATTSAPTKRKKLRRLTRRDKVVLSLMVAIPTLIEALLVWLPAAGSIALSFTKWDGIDLGGIKSNGIQNYKYIFTDYPQFWPAVEHNILWLVFLSVIATPLGLLFAVLLDRRIRGSKIYQTAFFLPVMLSLALVSIIWELMYDRQSGLINNMLGTAGSNSGVDWLGNPHINIWSALIATTWRHSGYIMILYLAGLRGVDPSLREAAALDGATEWQTFWRVVFPAMRPINIVVVVITIIEALRAFDIVYVFNGGTNGLELLSALVIQNLKGEGLDIGVGAALATVLLVVSLIPITLYLRRAFRKDFDA